MSHSLYWPGTGVLKTRHNHFNWRQYKPTVAPQMRNGQAQRNLAEAKKLKTVQHWSIA